MHGPTFHKTFNNESTLFHHAGKQINTLFPIQNEKDKKVYNILLEGAKTKNQPNTQNKQNIWMQRLDN